MYIYIYMYMHIRPPGHLAARCSLGFPHITVQNSHVRRCWYSYVDIKCIVDINMYDCIHIYIYIYIYMCTCMCICIYTCMSYIYMYIYDNIYIYYHICIYELLQTMMRAARDKCIWAHAETTKADESIPSYIYIYNDNNNSNCFYYYY